MIWEVLKLQTLEYRKLRLLEKAQNIMYYLMALFKIKVILKAILTIPWCTHMFMVIQECTNHMAEGMVDMVDMDNLEPIIH